MRPLLIGGPHGAVRSDVALRPESDQVTLGNAEALIIARNYLSKQLGTESTLVALQVRLATQRWKSRAKSAGTTEHAIGMPGSCRPNAALLQQRTRLTAMTWPIGDTALSGGCIAHEISMQSYTHTRLQPVGSCSHIGGLSSDEACLTARNQCGIHEARYGILCP